MLYKVTILTALLSVGFGISLEKEDGTKSSRQLLGSKESYQDTYGGSSYRLGSTYYSLDGTYDFNCMGEALQLNVCSDEYSRAVSVSINKINIDNLEFADYIFATLRDSDGIQSDGDNFRLDLDGYQFAVVGQGFVPISYTLNFNKRTNEVTLTRDDEWMILRRSATAQNACFEADGNFIEDIQYPITLQSVGLLGSGLCAEDNLNCFDREHIMSLMGDSCFSVTDGQTGDPLSFGNFSDMRLVSEDRLLLVNWENNNLKSDRAACKFGSQMFVITNGRIVTSWRCEEGNLGYTYSFTRSDEDSMCPMFVREERDRRPYGGDEYERPERPYGEYGDERPERPYGDRRNKDYGGDEYNGGDYGHGGDVYGQSEYGGDAYDRAYGQSEYGDEYGGAYDRAYGH